MPLTFDLDRVRRLRVEAGLAQQEVDEQVAGLGLAVVVGVGDRLVRGLGGGDLGLQRLDLGFERGTAFLADAPRRFGGFAGLDCLLEAAGDLLQLRERRRGDLRDARQRLDAEGRIGRRLRARAHRCARANRRCGRIRAGCLRPVRPTPALPCTAALPVSFTKRALTASVRPTSAWKLGSASSAASVGS